MRIVIGALVAVSLLCLVQPLQAQCQNQICFWEDRCYKCQSAAGFACSVRPNVKCAASCTETHCGSGASAEYASCESSPKALALLREPKLILAQYQPSSSSTAFLFKPGSEQDPVMILSTTHDAKRDLLDKALLKNQGSSYLTAYRIGWLLFPRGNNAAPEIHTGPMLRSFEPVKPGATFEVSAQRVDPHLLKSVKMIVFFVAEATYSDGTDWKANTAEIVAEYQNALNH